MESSTHGVIFLKRSLKSTNFCFSRGSAIDLDRGVKMSWISQNWVKVWQIFCNLWVQLSLSQKLRGQFDPLHPSNGDLLSGVHCQIYSDRRFYKKLEHIRSWSNKVMKVMSLIFLPVYTMNMREYSLYYLNGFWTCLVNKSNTVPSSFINSRLK